jgi:hypothetical protein
VSDDKNLTGDQISSIMDNLLYTALKPIVMYTDIFDTQLVYIQSVITSNKKRKLVSAERQDALDTLCRIHLERSRQIKFELIKNLGIERSYIHCFLNRLLKKYRKNFYSLYNKFITNYEGSKTKWSRQISLIEKELGAIGRTELYLCFNQSSDYLDMFYLYQQEVAAEYVRLCSSQAKQHVDSNPNNHYDFLDVRQGLLHNVVIALNKYDANKGALTSYIKWWLFHAQTCNSSDHEYGIAYTIPQGQKKKLAEGKNNASVNFSTSLDQIVEEEDGVENLHNRVTDGYNVSSEVAGLNGATNLMFLAKHADLSGCARLSMDIGEVFSKKEIEKMKNHMKKQGLARLL